MDFLPVVDVDAVGVDLDGFLLVGLFCIRGRGGSGEPQGQ